jgi:hypothetical protein
MLIKENHPTVSAVRRPSIAGSLFFAGWLMIINFHAGDDLITTIVIVYYRI